MKTIILTLMLLCVTIAYTQTIYTISGTIRNKKNKVLSNWPVELGVQNGTIVGPSSIKTNTQGYYSFKFTSRTNPMAMATVYAYDACGNYETNIISVYSQDPPYVINFTVTDVIDYTFKAKIKFYNQDSIALDTLHPQIKITNSYPGDIAADKYFSYSYMSIDTNKKMYYLDIPCANGAQIICSVLGYYYTQVNFTMQDTVLHIYLTPIITNIADSYKIYDKQVIISKPKPILITSITGQIIYSNTPKSGDVIDLSRFSAGIYIINGKKLLLF